jgi:tRNA (mo5U34)-methyltransferase
MRFPLTAGLNWLKHAAVVRITDDFDAATIRKQKRCSAGHKPQRNRGGLSELVSESMADSKIDVAKLVASVPFWWHSIDVGEGIVTPGYRSAGGAEDLAVLALPDLRGLSVLDIGAWDGFYSFAAERAGARRVVALDYYVWALDLERFFADWRECETPQPGFEQKFLQPDQLPGKRGFDVAHRLLGSQVEERVLEFMEADLGALGVFDVVLYLGVLYHMTDPLGALRRVREVTGSVAIIETQAVVLRGMNDKALVEFYPGAELNRDPSNWWVPTDAALVGLCQAAGFSSVETRVGPPPLPDGASELQYRAVVHAHV